MLQNIRFGTAIRFLSRFAEPQCRLTGMFVIFSHFKIRNPCLRSLVYTRLRVAVVSAEHPWINVYGFVDKYPCARGGQCFLDPCINNWVEMLRHCVIKHVTVSKWPQTLDRVSGFEVTKNHKHAR